MADYQLQIAAHGATTPDIEVPFVNNLQYVEALNDSGSISFEMDLEHPKCDPTILAPGKKEIWLLRYGVKVWGGYLEFAQPSMDQATVRFSGPGYLGMFSSRFINSDLNYVGVDQFQIGWNLINYSQGKTNGALGITRGSAATSGVTRDRHYQAWEFASILDSLQELTAVNNGFDIEIDQNRVYNNFYPTKGSAIGQRFELGKNISGLSYDVDATSMANYIAALGSGTGSNMCIAVVSDATSEAAFGLREESLSMTDIKNYSTLQDASSAELVVKKGARIQPQLACEDPPFDIAGNSIYSVGDTSIIQAQKGFIQLSTAFRIATIDVQATNEGDEVTTITFDGITS